MTLKLNNKTIVRIVYDAILDEFFIIDSDDNQRGNAYKTQSEAIQDAKGMGFKIMR